MASIITQKLIDSAMTYAQYKECVLGYARDSLPKKKSEEILKKDASDNVKRIASLDDSILLNEECKLQVNRQITPVTWLAIVEPWCVDTAEILPYIHQISLYNPKISFKICLRDSPPFLIESFLTNRSKSIPIIVAINNLSLIVQGTWGPRPIELQVKVMMKYRQLAKKTLNNEEESVEKERIKKEVQLWYKTDNGVAIQEEMTNCLVINF